MFRESYNFAEGEYEYCTNALKDKFPLLNEASISLGPQCSVEGLWIDRDYAEGTKMIR